MKIMNMPFPRISSLFIFTSLCLLPARHALADASASSQLSVGSLSITPDTGTFLLLSPWESSVFAQAGVDNEYLSGNGTVNATGDYSSASAQVSTPATLTLDVSGQGNAGALVPGQIDASDSATGQSSMGSTFEITGGSGSVNVSFSAMLTGALSVFTDAFGQSAYSEGILTLEVDGSPVLFNDTYYDIGSSSSDGTSLSTMLNGSTSLQYDTPYDLGLYLDTEAIVSNVPEPAAGTQMLAGMILLGVAGALKKRKAIKITVWRMIRLVAVAAPLWLGANAGAMYIGAEAPDVCLTCGLHPTRQSGGNAQMSLSEGNLREDYAGPSVKSSGGPTLPFNLVYNSYNADNSRAQVNTGLGYGWTHSFNIFLFQQRSHMFRMDGEGRVTQYRFTGDNSYVPDVGYFETLTHNPDGSFTITNKAQSWWHFESVADTPYYVGGPIYRLTEMGDRNQNVTTLSYSNGLLVLITDTYGRSLSLGYTNQYKLAQVADPLGRVTRFQYDSLFRMPVSITDPAGKVVRYTYNSQYQLTRKIDRDGRMYFYTYRNQRPFSVIDGAGQTYFTLANPSNWSVNHNSLALNLELQYTPSTTASTDGLGNVWRYQYDTNGYIIQATAPDGSTTRYEYNSSRLLSEKADADGNVTTFQYDSMGNRTNVTDALGEVTTYAYDPRFNQVTSMTDPNGRVTTYQYDAYGNRTNTIDPLGQTNSYSYDTHGNMISQVDKLGRTTTYSYDAAGNRTNMVDALGNVTRYTYDAVGNRLSTTDPLGRTTTYAYDALNRLVDRTNALAGVIIYTYDALGRRTQVTDPNGNTTTYTYDTRGRLNTTTDPLGGVTTDVYDANDNRLITINPLGWSTTYAYDTLNREIAATNALGGVTTFAYDPYGNVIASTDADGHATTYAYDALNRRVTTMDALGHVTRDDYSSIGGPPCCSPTIGSSLITRLEDADGHVTFYNYDKLDRLTETIRKVNDTNDVINAGDAVSTYTYDAVNNRTSVTEPDGNVTTNFYDDLNRLTLTINAANDMTAYTYDAVGNQTMLTAPNGNVTTNVYDALNRVITVYDEIGPVRSTTYDPDGNVIALTDALGHTTTYQYDALNRQVEMIDALGQTTTTTYDADSNRISTTDRNGHTTTYYYDGLDRRTAVTDALGNTTTTTYDPASNIIALTDANGHTTTYIYDALNRRTIETYPDTPPNSRTNVYDAVGNIISRHDQKGQVTTYSYSPLYFLTNRAYLPSGANDSFTYDLSGRMLSANRNGWVDTFTYDGANRMTGTVQNGQPLTYTYNIPGRVQTNTQPSGRTLNYTYDARSRLVTLNDTTPNPPIAAYTYDADNRVINRAGRNGTLAAYTYDADNRITSLEHSNNVSLIAGFGYAYDAEGNKLYEQKLNAPGDSEAYAYDDIYRLVIYDVGTLSGNMVPSPILAKTWSLDPLGNWDTVTSNSVPELRTYGPANELLTVNANVLAYDANGNLTRDPVYNYFYDEENRLTEVQRISDSAIIGQYQYDALGRRVIEYMEPAGTPATNVYYYDNARIIEVQNAGGATQATYTYGNYIDEVLTMDRPGMTYYYHPNALWSVAAVTDGTASPVERYAYDAYGQVMVLDAAYNPVPLNPWGTPHSAVGNSYLFTGRELDEESGLYFYRARYFDCLNGRFLQRDSLEYTNGMNLYEYVRSNPINRTDPTGLWETDGAANPSANTIVCDGAGGIRAQIGDIGDRTQTECLRDCVEQHENSHADDARTASPNLCKDKAAGTQVIFSTRAEQNASEIKASDTEITCLKDKAKNCAEKCKKIIDDRIKQMEAYRDSFK
jgi:RHS repeat-associated protein